jgi:hypothetical protein
MKGKKLQFLILVVSLLLTNSCTKANTSSAENLLIASTPGDDSVKEIFRIPVEKKIDFIRWHLILNQNQTFALNLNFGEGQPNTNGFKGGGEKLSFSGTYAVSNNIYELKSGNFSAQISLIKLNENLFHLLTSDGKLMVGNGGWSYTLTRKDADVKYSPITWKSPLAQEIAQEVIYDGRTPCADFPEQSANCYKLKWRLTLFRDKQTNEPTVYALRGSLYNHETRQGKWTIKRDGETVIYQLDNSFSFLVGDENVLFFLDRRNQLLTGNSDFSFTLNRKK